MGLYNAIIRERNVKITAPYEIFSIWGKFLDIWPGKRFILLTACPAASFPLAGLNCASFAASSPKARRKTNRTKMG
jgi:hypothetical protein